MALTIKSPTETIFVKPSATDSRAAVLGVDSEGSNIKLGNQSVNAEMDTYNGYFRMYRLVNDTYTSLNLTPVMQLDKKMIVTSDTNQLVIHNPSLSSADGWEAGIWISDEGGNLVLLNPAGTCEQQFDMIGNEARWYRRWLSGTQYFNEIRLRDNDIYMSANTNVNGKVSASNVQAKTEIRQFYSNGNDLIPDEQPSGAYLSCIGTGEIDFNTLSVRIKVCIWAHGGGGWSNSNCRICRPAHFLNLLSLSSNYEFDADRITGARTYASGSRNYYQLGHIRWNATTQGGAYEGQGPYILYANEDGGWIMTARIYQNTWSGLNPEDQISATALGAWQHAVVVDGGGITADFVLPIKAK